MTLINEKGKQTANLGCTPDFCLLVCPSSFSKTKILMSHIWRLPTQNYSFLGQKSQAFRLSGLFKKTKKTKINTGEKNE